jgi:hypothetical protein
MDEHFPCDLWDALRNWAFSFHTPILDNEHAFKNLHTFVHHLVLSAVREEKRRFLAWAWRVSEN